MTTTGPTQSVYVTWGRHFFLNEKAYTHSPIAAQFADLVRVQWHKMPVRCAATRIVFDFEYVVNKGAHVNTAYLLWSAAV